MERKKFGSILILLIGLILILSFSACTKKNNLTGDNVSGIVPRIAIADSFSLGYSYTHEGKVKGTESYIICGEEDGIEAIGVWRFTGLRDTMTVIGEPVLKLVATRRSPLDSNPLALSFHKLAQHWTPDSTDMILDSNISPLSIPNFTVADSISSAGDTLAISIPAAVIENWKMENVTGFNLVIKTVDGGWLEFKANELANGALLNFKYKVPGSADTLTYNQRAFIDSYRVTGDQSAITTAAWKLKNLLPQRMFFRFALQDELFTDGEGVVLSALDRKRMTINKAELVLFVKDNPYYGSVRCNFYPYQVKMDTLAVPTVLTDNDLQIISNTFSSGTIISADSVKIDVTAVIQGFTSGNVSNNGIVIKNTAEMQNFGKVEFWHSANAPAGKKPYIKIHYTTPFLKGD